MTGSADNAQEKVTHGTVKGTFLENTTNYTFIVYKGVEERCSTRHADVNNLVLGMLMGGKRSNKSSTRTSSYNLLVQLVPGGRVVLPRERVF